MIIAFFALNDGNEWKRFQIPSPPVNYERGDAVSRQFKEELLLLFGVEFDTPVLLVKEEEENEEGTKGKEKEKATKNEITVSLSQPWQFENAGRYRLRLLESRACLGPKIKNPDPHYTINSISGKAWDDNLATFLEFEADVSWTSTSAEEIKHECYFELEKSLEVHRDYNCRIHEYSPSVEQRSAIVQTTKERGWGVEAKAEATQSGGGGGVSASRHASTTKMTTVDHENYNTAIRRFSTAPPGVLWAISPNLSVPNKTLPPASHLRKLFRIVWKVDKKAEDIAPRFSARIGYQKSKGEASVHTVLFHCTFVGTEISFEEFEEKKDEYYNCSDGILPPIAGSMEEPILRLNGDEKENYFLRVEKEKCSYFQWKDAPLALGRKKKKIYNELELTVSEIWIDISRSEIEFRENDDKYVICVLSMDLLVTFARIRPDDRKSMKLRKCEGGTETLGEQVKYFLAIVQARNPNSQRLSDTALKSHYQQDEKEQILELAEPFIDEYDAAHRNLFHLAVKGSLESSSQLKLENEQKDSSSVGKKAKRWGNKGNS